jgi:hypothetical protein
MPTPYSNFSTPDDPNAPPTSGPGQGAPANAVWDPVQQRWVGSSTANNGGAPSGAGGPMPGPQPRPPGSTWSMGDKQFVPASTAMSTGYASPYGQVSGSNTIDGSAPTEGRVSGFDGKTVSGGAWGGYVGTNVRNPDGTITLDPTMNGTTADISRFEEMAAEAANRTSYKNDYTQANNDALYGEAARQGQGNGIALARNIAMGADDGSRALGNSMLNQGLQTQQAAAMSRRGGSLAQAAAMHQQRNGAGAYMQQGHNQMLALQADQMANARREYSEMATTQRNGDATVEGLHASQTKHQLDNDVKQANLNLDASLGYNGMAQNVDKSSQDAALKAHEISVGIDAAASTRANQQANRDLQTTGAIVGAVGAGAAHVGGMLNDGNDPNNPNKKYTGSDERMKTNARPMGLAAVASRWAALGGGAPAYGRSFDAERVQTTKPMNLGAAAAARMGMR